MTTVVFIGPCPWFSLLLAWPMPQDAPRQGRPRVGEHEPTTKTEPAADRKKDLHHQMPEIFVKMLLRMVIMIINERYVVFLTIYSQYQL